MSTWGRRSRFVPQISWKLNFAPVFVKVQKPLPRRQHSPKYRNHHHARMWTGNLKRAYEHVKYQKITPCLQFLKWQSAVTLSCDVRYMQLLWYQGSQKRSDHLSNFQSVALKLGNFMNHSFSLTHFEYPRNAKLLALIDLYLQI